MITLNSEICCDFIWQVWLNAELVLIFKHRLSSLESILLCQTSLPPTPASLTRALIMNLHWIIQPIYSTHYGLLFLDSQWIFLYALP